jgi:hypothetical protein
MRSVQEVVMVVLDGKAEHGDEKPWQVLVSRFDLACSNGLLVVAALKAVIQTHRSIGHSSYAVVAVDSLHPIALQSPCQISV